MTKKNCANCRIRKGDRVIGIAGDEKGRVGTVLARMGDKIIVEKFNIHKKHVKRSEQHPQGGVIEREAPIHASNVRLVGEDGRPVKLRARLKADGRRELYYYLADGREVIHRAL